MGMVHLLPVQSDGPFRLAYETLLYHIVTHGEEELNARTGKRVRMAHGPAYFAIDLSDRRLPMCGVRRMFPATAAAEVAWFVRGDRDVEFIRGYAPIWDKFVEDDGRTIEAAYGYRWREHFGRDQLGDAVDALRANSSDRRTYIGTWDPAQDGLGRPGKNVPCPVGFSLSIVGGRLNSGLTIRSSDVFVGLPYDVMGHALLMAAIAQSVGVELGTMGVMLCHPHVYDVHFDMAREALDSQPSDDTREMPTWLLSDVLHNPHGYVDLVKRSFADVERPAYSCRPEVVA